MGQFFISEVELAKEQRDNLELIDGRQNTDLRFFKGILGEELHETIREQVLDPLLTAQQIYDNNVTAIESAVTGYLENKTLEYVAGLLATEIITPVYNDRGILNNYRFFNVEGKTLVNREALTREIAVQTANYIIANMDQQKILYGDPYQYKDELKRTKSFLSPRQPLISDSPQWNAKANDLYNRDYTPGTIGYTDFTKDYFSTVTYGDVIGVSELPNYDSFEETDGAGLITEKADRNFQLRTGTWNADKERQYRYNVAFEKNHS